LATARASFSFSSFIFSPYNRIIITSVFAVAQVDQAFFLHPFDVP
jgi:hypothetical protein